MSFAKPELGGLDFPDELLARVKPELRPDERLVWAGRPVRVPPISRASVAWAFGCLGTTSVLAVVFLSLFLEVFDFQGMIESRDVFGILGTLFAILAGLATIAWTFGGINDLTERQRVAREVYAVTDLRAMIWAPGDTRRAIQFFSHDRGHFDRIHREERPDGSGSLNFSNSRNRYNPGPKQFREIADVKRVEALARQYVIAESLDKDELTKPDLSTIRRDIDT